MSDSLTATRKEELKIWPNGSLASSFSGLLSAVSERVLDNAVEHGFVKGDETTGEDIALMHSELSEMLEAFREETMPMSSKIPAFTLAEEELADLVIRAVHFARRRGMALGPAIIAKHNYNVDRPFKHGGKKF